jgi:DNA-binding CsgD family transcriptional regulator
MAGGALSIVGWLMPWSGAVITSFSGLQITVTALTGSFAGLGTLQYSSAGLLLVCLGLFVFAVFGAIPLLGALCVRTGLSIFELKATSARSQYQIQEELDRLRSRSIKGVVLLALIFLVPLILSALASAVLPGLFVLGQLGSLLPNTGYGSGFFVSAGGFVLAYMGARLAQPQISLSVSDATERPATRAYGNELTQARQGEISTPMLSADESQILLALAQGVTDQEIADKLGMSPGHVSMMTLGLFGKFGVKSKTELIERAKEKGLLPSG